MIPGNANPLLLATAAEAAAAAGVATRSLRFNAGDSAHLSRTPSSAGNVDKWTWAGWIKRTAFGAHTDFFSAVINGQNATIIQFDNNDRLDFENFVGNSDQGRLITEQVFRDPSAWYHITCIYDSGNSTADDRIKLFVNGSQVTTINYRTNPSSGSNSIINSTNAHYVGVDKGFSNHYFNGYLADVYLIDGAAVEPVDNFIELDDNGVYQARAYSGTFGTNGFNLKFDDASNNAALGTDSSGNDNDFTVNNLVASAPATAKGGFDVVTYTGTGSSQSITSLAFQPDFVWIKVRNAGSSHRLFDSVRGAGKHLLSNDTGAEETHLTSLSGFTSDGFTLGANAEGATNVNQSGGSYVAWCWKAGGTAVSNTDGSITSSVSASTDYGFSILTYTGTGSNATVGHGLSSAPKWIIVKDRSQATGWSVYHDAIGTSTNNYIELQSTGVAGQDDTAFQDTAPTNSVFSIGTKAAVNQNGDNFVAYCWSEVPGFSSFGSYEGDGDGTGPDVTTGFKPRLVIIKGIDEAAGWRIYDSVRGTSAVLRTNLSNNEFTTSDPIVFLSDGFRLTGTTNEETNKSGRTYIYAAFSGEPPGDLVDSLFDSPTNGAQEDTGAGGEVSGNYATMNPVGQTKTEYFTEDGNLTCGNSSVPSGSSGSRGFVPSTIGFKTGKWYCECVTTKASDGDKDFAIGIFPADSTGYFSTSGHYAVRQEGTLFSPAGTNQTYGTSFDDGDVIGIAVDMDSSTKTIQWFKNGTAIASATTIADKEYFFGYGSDGGGSGRTYRATWNFGQRAWAYSAPSGFKALCTTNLPTATVPDGSDYFDTKLWTGNSSTQTISGYEFSPDFVWIKVRSENSRSHFLFDTIRGTAKALKSDATDAEQTYSTSLTAFNSDGFDLGAWPNVNNDTKTIVGWAWDAASSTSSNTDGDVTSSVRVNQTAGFSICKWTGSNTNGYTVGHGLNAKPDFMIFKNTDASFNWHVYHSALGATKVLRLNLTNAELDDAGFLNDTEPTSSVFTTGSFGVWDSDKDTVGYIFSAVEGFSSFGSYQGNGSSDGPFVHTGFRPRWIMFKNTGTSPWNIYDTARDTFNVVENGLLANSEDDEFSGTDRCDILSNGFKLRGGGGVEPNQSGNTYLYMCFAENPFQANGGLAR